MADNTAKIQVGAEKLIGAPAPVVYRIIADYREHHPNILPPAFSNLTVDEGGIGEGTAIQFDLRVGGQKRHMQARVEEPEPGRVLQERYLESGGVTIFEVIPAGTSSQVRIRTESPARGGIQGWIERRLAPRMLHQLYVDELDNLDRYARQQAADVAPSS